jgi:hypothetical protein
MRRGRCTDSEREGLLSRRKVGVGSAEAEVATTVAEALPQTSRKLHLVTAKVYAPSSSSVPGIEILLSDVFDAKYASNEANRVVLVSGEGEELSVIIELEKGRPPPPAELDVSSGSTAQRLTKAGATMVTEGAVASVGAVTLVGQGSVCAGPAAHLGSLPTSLHCAASGQFLLRLSEMSSPTWIRAADAPLARMRITSLEVVVMVSHSQLALSDPRKLRSK